LRPTGFTFEPCAVEVCKSRADELIAKFHPVLQTKTALNKGLAGINQVKGDRHGLGDKAYSDRQEFPRHERERQSKVRRNFHFKWTHATTLGAIFVATAVAVFYPDMPFDYVIQKRANDANASSGQVDQISLKPQDVSSIDTGGSLANQSAEPMLARADVHASVSTPNIATVSATKSTPDNDQEMIQANTTPMAHSLGNAQSGKKWSVQVSATPKRDIADTLVRRLKAKGYDAYVVQTEVKGQTYYRVRVGPFDSRQDAQSVHQSLTRQEGYQDAYPTRN
jgi:cell division septation protein DedD